MATVCKRWSIVLKATPDPLRDFQRIAHFYSPTQLQGSDVFKKWQGHERAIGYTKKQNSVAYLRPSSRKGLLTLQFIQCINDGREGIGVRCEASLDGAKWAVKFIKGDETLYKSYCPYILIYALKPDPRPFSDPLVDPLRSAAITLALTDPRVNHSIRFATQDEVEQNIFSTCFISNSDELAEISTTPAEHLLEDKNPGDFVLWYSLHETLKDQFHLPTSEINPKCHHLSISFINKNGTIEHRQLTKTNSGALLFGKTAYPDLDCLLESNTGILKNPILFKPSVQ